MSSKFRNLILILVLVTVGVCTVTGPAQAQSGACSAKKARKEMVKARKAYREADRVWSSTKKFSRLHGPDVGRWVRLARESGWSWSQFDQLMYVVWRESRGNPGAYNDVIGCTGLLQIWPGNVDEPSRLTQPKYNLEQGLRLFKEYGWQPWAI